MRASKLFGCARRALAMIAACLALSAAMRSIAMRKPSHAIRSASEKLRGLGIYLDPLNERQARNMIAARPYFLRTSLLVAVGFVIFIAV